MILVTGGTGFIGRHLVHALVEAGTPVRVLVRDPERAHTLPAGATLVPGDILDSASLASAMAGMGAVVHLAAQMHPSSSDGTDMTAANVTGTRAVVESARAGGVDHIVYVSSAGVYGSRATPEPIAEADAPNPQTAYERTKLAGEEIVRAHARSWTVLRPAGVFGSGRPHTTAFLRAVAARRFWLQGGPDTLLNPAYVHDVVAAIMFALERPIARGEVINVGGPRVVSHRELVDVTAAALGRSARHIRIPPGLTRAGASAGKATLGFLGRPVPQRLTEIGSTVVNRAVSTDKAQRFGISLTSLARAMAETVAQFSAAPSTRS